MRTALEAEQIERYRERGFLRLDRFLAADELTELTDAVTGGVAEMGGAKLAGVDPSATPIRDDPGTWYDRVFLQRVNLWRISAVVRRFVMAPALGRMLCDLEGIDGIRVWHDQTLQKRPWANPTTWHADGPNWSFHSRHAVTIWIALDRATIPNGCLWFIPGSHRVTRFHQFPITENMDRVFDDYPELASREAEAVELAPGSAAVFNGMLVHGAGPNMTSGWRRAMTCAYMPDGTTYNGQRNILTDEQVARLRPGSPLDDDAQNPVVWSRTRAPTFEPPA